VPLIRPAICTLIALLSASCARPSPPSIAPARPVDVARRTPIHVKAGRFERIASIVTFTLPEAVAASGALALQGQTGERLPLQLGPNRQATFILPKLAAGAELVLSIVPIQGTSNRATAAVEGVGVALAVDTRAVARYQLGGKLPAGMARSLLRGGYLHPVYTPGGALVTDDYAESHRHHHGIWTAWAKSSFEGREIDFWNMDDGTAKVDFDALLSTWQGPVHAGLAARHLFVDLSGPAPETALVESWRITVYATHSKAVPYFVIDLESVQEASASPVVLSEYRYGGLGIHGHASWTGPEGARFLTSEGKTRLDGDGTRGRWCHIGGLVNGSQAGLAVLDHPGNFRAPQPLRLNPKDAFFSYAPVREGSFVIEPGRPLASRYRFIVSDGPPDPALLDRLWRDFAEPPAVTVSH